MARSFLTMKDLTRDELEQVFDKIKLHKADIKDRKTVNALQNRVVGLIFEKPSTRTRNGFESAIWRLGGSAVYMASGDLQLGRGEPIKDTARILGGYMDALVARVYAHKTVEEFAADAGVPVINALSDLTHPTQAVCDLFTVLEVKGRLQGLKLTYIGDGNNVCNSLLLACAITGMDMVAACPKGYFPNEEFVSDAKKFAEGSGSKIEVLEDPKAAAEGADILYTDTWVSMGEDAEKEKKVNDLKGYQINSEIVKLAAPDAKVMHCLPAYRGYEITDDVMEGPQSIIWQQGENKMHSAAGLLDFFLS